MYDQILHETLQGNFALEFTYGNGFGDHSYFFLLFLLPIKAVLDEYMVYVLILLGPTIHGLSALISYLYFRQANGPQLGLMYGLIFLLSFGLIIPGLYEETYGFHPDILAGFLAVVFTLFLIAYHKLQDSNRAGKKALIGLLISFGLFICLKEEMAALGVLFSLILFVWKRERLYFIFLVGSSIFLFFSFTVIKLAQTAFNRTNDLLIEEFVNSVKVNGLYVLFFQPDPYGKLLPSYWATIAIFSVLMGVAVWATKQVDVFGFTLFVTGLAKMGTSFLVYDFSILTWHNFPGIVMMTGAILIQMSSIGKFQVKRVNLVASALLGGTIMIFFSLTIPYFLIVQKAINYNAGLVQQVEPALLEVKNYIEPQRIVTIPPYTAFAWVDGYRYAFYPRGINESPAGIADYVVLPSAKNVMFTDFDPNLETPALYEEFDYIFENDQFMLLKRIQVAEIHQKDRDEFARLFGRYDEVFIEFQDEATLK